MDKRYFRVIDANLNRLKEGIRVVEDILRFVYDDKKNSLRLKNLRHLAKINNYENILKERDIKNDVLKISIRSEQKREDIYYILLANFKRAQESSRVLEEVTKLLNIKDSENFKYIRYELYDLERVLINITSNSK